MQELTPIVPPLRPTPMTGFGKKGQDIGESKNLQKIKKNIDEIFSKKPDNFTEAEDNTTKEYYQKYYKYYLILNVLGKQPIITPIEYEQLFGGPYTPLLPVHLLLESFRIHFPKLNETTSLEFACRAYLDADPSIIHKLISMEKKPEKLFLIARLMHSFATNFFDRNPMLGGKKSRSKKRGRNFIHRHKSVRGHKKSSNRSKARSRR